MSLKGILTTAEGESRMDFHSMHSIWNDLLCCHRGPWVAMLRSSKSSGLSENEAVPWPYVGLTSADFYFVGVRHFESLGSGHLDSVWHSLSDGQTQMWWTFITTSCQLQWCCYYSKLIPGQSSKSTDCWWTPIWGWIEWCSWIMVDALVLWAWYTLGKRFFVWAQGTVRNIRKGVDVCRLRWFENIRDDYKCGNLEQPNRN